MAFEFIHTIILLFPNSDFYFYIMPLNQMVLGGVFIKFSIVRYGHEGQK